MTQCDIDEAVASVTGEDLSEIQRRGFSIADQLNANFDPEPYEQSPNFVDWDELDLQNNVALFAQPDQLEQWAA